MEFRLDTPLLASICTNRASTMHNDKVTALITNTAQHLALTRDVTKYAFLKDDMYSHVQNQHVEVLKIDSMCSTYNRQLSYSPTALRGTRDFLA